MREFWVAIGLLWLAGVSLRLTVLAVPPVIPQIQADLNLSGTEIGFLSGLLVAAVASGPRGAMLDVFVLYAATVVMSAGISVMQPALPPLIQQWTPRRVTFGTAVCTNGLLVGETLGVMLMVPLLALVDGSWRWSFAVLGLPLLVTAILTAALAPKPEPTGVASA